MEGGSVPPQKPIGPVIETDDKDLMAGALKEATAGDLRFEWMAAQNAATEASKAIGKILGIEEAMSEITLDNLSQLRSGSQLATMFNNTLNALGEVLGGHKDSLTNAMEMYKLAGKKYIDVDLDNASDISGTEKKRYGSYLDGIKAPTRPSGRFLTEAPKKGSVPKTQYLDGDNDGEAVPLGNRDFINTTLTDKEEDLTTTYDGTPVFDPAKVVKTANLPNSLSNFLGSNQTQPKGLQQNQLEIFSPDPENPDSQLWRDLYELGQHTGDAIKPVDYASKMWKWMAEVLDDAVGSYAKNIANTPEDQWRGSGRNAATKAVKDYSTKVADLTTRMHAMADNLKYTSEWLADTKKGMPTQPNPPKTQTMYYEGEGGSGSYDAPAAIVSAANKRDLAIYRQNMENNYVSGVQASSLLVPALNEIPSTAPKVDEDGKATDSTGDGGGGGGSQDTGGGSQYTGGGPGGPGLSYTGGNNLPTGEVQDQGQTQKELDRQRLAAEQAQRDQQAFDREQRDFVRQQQQEQADFDQQQRALAAQQQQDQATQQAAAAGQQAMQQAMYAGQQAAEQAARAAQEKQLADKAFAGLPGIPPIPGMDIDPKTGLPKLGGGPGPGLASSPVAKDLAQASKLFPRAGTAVTAAGAAAAAGRAGLAPLAGAGTPGAPGAAGRNAGGESGNQHKPPTWLQSTEALEDALGDAPRVVRPVIER
ncbi:hypothetical protein OH799_28610 [Nocardia sp. NBC_00881]|uniref:hypothetical protein n=1 Tax=Nocardia sp. NBC_00881 TaxID=2975995 RepID=UPI003865FE13|nr:hypothetical protein OH799_28610 [Nocardia sp. NBC_00881]